MSDFAAATIAWGSETITLLQRVKDIQCITDDGQDDEIALYLQMAGEGAESYCDNKLCLQACTEQIARSHSPVALRYWPFVSLTTVVDDTEDVTADWETFISDGVAYVTSNRTAINHATGFQQLVLEYQAGYEPLPAELGEAICRASINLGQQATGAVKKESVVGVGSVEYQTDDGIYGGFTSGQLSILAKYARWYA